MDIPVAGMQETNCEEKVLILDFLAHKVNDYLGIC